MQLFGGRRGESWRYGRLLKTYVSGGGSPRSHGAAFNASKNYRGGNILCIEDCWNYYWNFNRCGISFVESVCISYDDDEDIQAVETKW